MHLRYLTGNYAVPAVTWRRQQAVHHGPRRPLRTSREEGGSRGKQAGEGRAPFTLIKTPSGVCGLFASRLRISFNRLFQLYETATWRRVGGSRICLGMTWVIIEGALRDILREGYTSSNKSVGNTLRPANGYVSLHTSLPRFRIHQSAIWISRFLRFY